MRRNMLSLLLAIAISSTGCSSLGKKKVDTWRGSEGVATTRPVAEQYAPLVEPFQYATTTTTSDYPADEVVSMPLTLLATQKPRFHVVSRKETLFSLARSYYSDQRRWKDIYAANATTIGDDPNRIFVGQRLRIP